MPYYAGFPVNIEVSLKLNVKKHIKGIMQENSNMVYYVYEAINRRNVLLYHFQIQ